MNCYVVCENVYRDDMLQSVNIIGVGKTSEDAKTLIESNREELKRLFDGKFVADYYDDDGSHEFCATSGVVYRTCACKSKMVAKQASTACNQLSNAAKMREALEETQSVIEKCMEILNRIPDGVAYDGLIDEVADELCGLRDSHVKPALSAPPRNFDTAAHQREIAELRECLEQAYGDKIGTYTMKGNEVERWRKALREKGGAK